MNLTIDVIPGQCTTTNFQTRNFLCQLWNSESNLVMVSTCQWCPITQFALNDQVNYFVEVSWRCPILHVSMGHFLRPGICPIHFATTELDNSWEPAMGWIDDCFCSHTCIHTVEQEEDGGHLLKLKSVWKQNSLKRVCINRTREVDLSHCTKSITRCQPLWKTNWISL